MKKKVNAEICRRWRVEEGVGWAANFGGSVMEGWPVSKPSKFSKELIDELELQALGGFGMIQNEKTPALGAY